MLLFFIALFLAGMFLVCSITGTDPFDMVIRAVGALMIGMSLAFMIVIPGTGLSVHDVSVLKGDCEEVIPRNRVCVVEITARPAMRSVDTTK